MESVNSVTHQFLEYGVREKMFKRQGIAFSLILGPDRCRGLRGFCLTPLISPLGKGDEGGGWIGLSEKETAQILYLAF